MSSGFINELLKNIDLSLAEESSMTLFMNVHHLELFYFVAKYEGITNAVRKMPYGIQQPAVSGQILQLEKSLGVKLFNRRPFTLTQAGEDLYDYVYPFFSKMPLVESQLKGEERNTLRIAASATVLKNHLPIVLGVMKKTNPDLRLHLRHVEPAEIEELIQDEEVDLAVTAVAGDPEGNLKMDKLLELSIVMFVPKTFKENTLEELLIDDEYERGKVIKYPLVGLGEAQILGKVFNKYMEKRDVHWTTEVQVDSLEVIHEYVLGGFGIGLGIQVPGRKTPEDLKVITLEECPKLNLGVIYQGKLKPLGTQFITHAREAATALEKYT